MAAVLKDGGNRNQWLLSKYNAEKTRGIVEWKYNSCIKPTAVSFHYPTLLSGSSQLNGKKTLPVGETNNTKLQKNILWKEIIKWY